MKLQTQLEIRVQYDAPALDCRRVLRVLPLRRAGQTVQSESWSCTPPADFTLEKTDAVRNRRLMLRHARIERELRFEMQLETEVSGDPVLEFSPDFARWKMPSRAVRFSPELQIIAREAKDFAPLVRASFFVEWCQKNLRYGAQTDASPLDASQVLQNKSGNCADFSHLFLSLCRCSGLAARYVAGFSRSQGQMHAWAEVWNDNHWHAFDPTLESTLDSNASSQRVFHIAVAVGRDFYDCAPHAGQFRGAGNASFELRCRTREMKEIIEFPQKMKRTDGAT